jgi:23S rRNA (cytosine1962-C5)-methyltransferase
MDHGARGVYVKRRLRADLRKQDPLLLAPPLPLRGSPALEEVCVRQGELRFWVRLGDGLATGLFLDQRESWERVRCGVRGQSLLNLFSYTGAFSVAAASGGASGSVSVDLSKRALGRLRLNLEHNGLSGPQHRLLASDVLVWLARAGRAQRRFGWIVLDPPSFGTRRGGVLRAERDYAGLVTSALGLLERGGRLLCVSHQLGLSQRELSELVAQAVRASGRAGRIENWVGGWDAATLPGVSGTKSVLAQVE